MAQEPFNGLFLCTGNSARSIIAEGILSLFTCFSFEKLDKLALKAKLDEIGTK